MSKKEVSKNLFVYGTSHAVVDGICAAIIFTILKNQTFGIPEFIKLVILYNILAFGLQSIFGLVVDYFKVPRLSALTGSILTGISAFAFPFFPIFSIISAGVGNALFHIGAGSISLNLTPTKATAPGLYVAPGALGLLVGTLLGKNGQFIPWVPVFILFILCLLMFLIKNPEINYEESPIFKKKINYFGIIFVLIFSSVIIRSFIGSALVFPWKTNLTLLVILTLAVVLGKAMGGILADKFGWMKMGISSLVLSIPLLIFGVNAPVLAIIGMFLFNITMPITLVTISNILPGHPAFSFGLTCLALIIGSFPLFVESNGLFSNHFVILSVIFISVLALYYGLRFYFKNSEEKRDSFA